MRRSLEKRVRLYLAASFTLFLVGCSALETGAAHQRALALTEAYGFEPVIVRHGDLALHAFVQGRPRCHKTLVVFLEGDGFAWRAKNRPSNDPTPRQAVGLKLALQSNAAAKAYLARPCQYLMTKRFDGCRPAVWTSHRFSRDVLATMSAGLDQLKIHYQDQAKRLVLVGYSGGATLALWLAETRDDVEGVITVAGVLDHASWTAHHGVTPLFGSLPPPLTRHRARCTPQVHVIGERDTIVPPALADAARAELGERALTAWLHAPAADHSCCWDTLWPDLERRAIADLRRQRQTFGHFCAASRDRDPSDPGF